MTDFKVLTDREHILLRPNMYLGSVSMESHEQFISGEYKTLQYTPALVKMINEIIDNSVDEAIRTNFKYANDIRVQITSTYVQVSDNGRGIPQDLIVTPEGEKLPRPVLAWTRAKAGSNFSDDRVTVGMNGVGSSLTAIFSTKFTGQTFDGKNKLVVKVNNNASEVIYEQSKSKDQGTIVTFEPDYSRLDCQEISEDVIELIKERLESLSAVYPKITFTLNHEILNLKLTDYFNRFGTNVQFKGTNYSVALAASTEGLRQNSYINGLFIKNGGSHLDFFLDQFCQELLPLIKKKHKKLDIKPARIKECLTFVMVGSDFNNPKFDSQTKERLTNSQSEVKSYFNLDEKKFKKFVKEFFENEELFDPIIEAALARILAAEKALETKLAKKVKKVNVPAHIKAGQKEGSILFLAEGNSASSNLLDARNPKIHGGFPLRGKVLNTHGETNARILENKELSNIMTILGLEFGKSPFEIDKHGNVNCLMNYDYIGLMTDADVDGANIQLLLLLFFSRWPDLFKHGRVRVIKAPRWILTSKTEELFFYSPEDYWNFRNGLTEKELSKYEIRYLKGLGSLRLHEYKKMINEPVYSEVKLNENYLEWLNMLFGDDSQPRKDWMMESVTPDAIERSISSYEFNIADSSKEMKATKKVTNLFLGL